MSNLKIVRLSTGEELIANVDTIDEAFYRLNNIAILYPTESNSLGLAPFMAYADTTDGIDLEPKDVMFVVSPVAGLAAQHGKMFETSQLVMPESKIII